MSNKMQKISISSDTFGELLVGFQEKRLEILSSRAGAHEFSKGFEAKMQKLIRRERKPYYPLVKTKARIVAVVAVLVFLLMTTTALAVEPIREKVFEFFVNAFKEFSIVTVEDVDANEAPAPTSIEDRYIPGYIPEGYALVEEDKSENFISTYYESNHPFNEIGLEQWTKQSFTPTINTEGITTTDIRLSNGMTGFYCTNKGVYIMVLQNQEYAFLLSSQGELDELMAFIESLIVEK
jgi:hypothetical protein